MLLKDINFIPTAYIKAPDAAIIVTWENFESIHGKFTEMYWSVERE